MAHGSGEGAIFSFFASFASASCASLASLARCAADLGADLCPLPLLDALVLVVFEPVPASAMGGSSADELFLDEVFLAAFLITPACKLARLVAQKRAPGGHGSTTRARALDPVLLARDWELVRRKKREGRPLGGESEGNDMALESGHR